MRKRGERAFRGGATNLRIKSVPRTEKIVLPRTDKKKRT